MILSIFISILIMALFLYSKLLPHKDRLDGRYKSAYQFCEKIFRPIFNLLQQIAKPVQVGQGLAVDTSQLFLLTILLFILIFT
jgi:hypothetical protein